MDDLVESPFKYAALISERAYIAGFFDGEGHASLRHRKGGGVFFAGVAQSGEEGRKCLTEIKSILERDGIKLAMYSEDRPYGTAKTPMHRLSATNRKSVMAFLKFILPFLRVKKCIVQDILRYDSMYPLWPKFTLNVVCRDTGNRTIKVRSKNGRLYRVAKKVRSL